MSEKYLKTGNLAKEMEKLAKKTAEEKKAIQDIMAEAEELLKYLHGTDDSEIGGKRYTSIFGTMIGAYQEEEEEAEEVPEQEESEAVEFVEKARSLLKENDLSGSREYIDKGIDILRKEARDNISELIDETREIHVLLQDEDNYKDSLKRLNEAESYKKENDLKGSLERAREARNLARLEIKEKLTDDFSRLESMLFLVEDRDDATDNIEATFQEATEAADNRDFSKAFSLAKECQDILSRDLKIQIKREMDMVVKQMDLIDEGVMDTDGFLNKVNTYLEKGHYDGALLLINDAKSDLNQALEVVVEKKEIELERELQEADELECDISGVKEERDQIEELIWKGRFSDAYEMIDSTLQKVSALKLNKVLRTIAESKNHFIKGKAIGIDINIPMEYLNKARDSLKEGDFCGALEWAKGGREKVRELVEEHEGLKLQLAEAQRMVNGLREIGIEPPEALKILDDAHDALKDKDYEQTKEMLDEFYAYLDEKLEPLIMDIVDSLEDHLNTAEEMGLNTTEYVEQTEVSIANIKSGKYVIAGQIAQTTLQTLESQIRGDLEKRIASLSGVIERVKAKEEYPEDIEEVTEALEDIEKSFEKGEFAVAHRTLEETFEDIRKWGIGEAEERYSQVKELLELIEDIGIPDIDVERYRKGMEEVSIAFWDDDFPTVINLSGDLIEEMSQDLSQTAKDVFTNAKKETVKVKHEGININVLRKRLKKCKENMKLENYGEVIKEAMKVEEVAKRLLDKRSTSYELIYDVSSELIKLKKEGRLEDTTPVKDLLQTAQECFHNHDYTQAESLALQARDKIAELEDKYRFVYTLRSFRQDLELALNLGIETDEVEKALDVNSILKEGDLDKGLLKIKAAQDALNQKLLVYIEPEINGSREMIQGAEEIGVDVSKPAELLDKAEEMRDERNFGDALRYLEECKLEMEKIKNRSRQAAGGLKYLKERIINAKDMYADITEANEYLKKAFDALNADDYDGAIEFVKKGEESVNLAERKRIYIVLKIFKKKIQEAKNDGMETSSAVKLIKKAERAAAVGKYNEAIYLAMQSEGEVEQIELQKEMAGRILANSNKRYQEALEMGVLVDESKRLLMEAERAYKGGFYLKTYDRAVKAQLRLKKRVRVFSELTKKLRILKDTVDDPVFGDKELKEWVHAVEEMIKEGMYEKASTTLKEIETKLDNL